MAKEKHIAFLRGINVGGHHKVPMADLRKEMEKLGLVNVTTILNSGNILFETAITDEDLLEKKISNHLEKVFGFQIPTMLIKAETLIEVIKTDPFKNINLTKDIRLYVSFLRQNVKAGIKTPWQSDDGSFKIIYQKGKTILSVLDLSVSKTPKAMEALEKYFGKDITTRNWNTIKRLEKKLS